MGNSSISDEHVFLLHFILQRGKFFNRKTGAILGGVVVTPLGGSYLTTAKLPTKEQIFEKNIETVLQEYSDAGFENVQTV